MQRNHRMLLDLLREDRYLTARQLARMLDVNEKTVRNRIGELSGVLEKNGGQVVGKQKLGYQLKITDRERFSLFLQQEKENKTKTLPTTNDERVTFLTEALITGERYLKLEDLSEQLYVSRNVVAGDLQKAEAVLRAYGIELCRRPNYGVCAVGDEFSRRVCLVNAVLKADPAAMVTLSRFRGKDPFRDPFCGSGTIPIEAALIALNRAPGLDRSFDAQRWGAVPARTWMEAAEEAMDQEFHGKYDIWGGDVDPKAVAIARENARKAGVEEQVRFETADMRNLRVTGEFGQIVTNPPYGERLLDDAGARALCRTFGEVYRSIPPRWRVLVLSSAEDFEKAFGRKADKKRKLYNGRLKCDLYFFQRG